MAILANYNLSLVFSYTKAETDCIHYQCKFCWQGQSIINDAVLKRSNEYWDDRPEGTFIASEYEKDGLLPLIRQVLETNKADYWEAVDPDFEVAIYPDGYFPFLPSRYKIIHESEDFKQKSAERARLKAEKGNLPDDRFAVMFKVDPYNFKDADTYYRDGLILYMSVTRQQLEEFASQLEVELGEILSRESQPVATAEPTAYAGSGHVWTDEEIERLDKTINDARARRINSKVI